jgi:PAS domain S-box-containing protein
MVDEPEGAVDSRLEESEARYRALIENASDMIQSIRPDGTFEFVNHAWHRILEYEPGDLPGMTMWDIIHPDSREHCELLFSRAMQGETVDNVRATFVTKSGRAVPAEGSATSRKLDGQVIATHGFFRDITERLHAEELARRNAELEQERLARYLEKMAALGKLSAGLAHELNNPASAASRSSTELLNALDRRDQAGQALTRSGITDEQRTFLEALIEQKVANKGDDGPVFSPLEASEHESAVEDWLEDHGIDEGWSLSPDLVAVGICEDDLQKIADQLPEQAIEAAVHWVTLSVTIQELTRVIARSTHRISELVSAVKSYSYMDRAVEQDVDIHDGIENTLIILAHQMKNMTVIRDYDRSLPMVRAFGSGLNQIWTNLIDNAIDATDGRGTMTIRTRRDANHVLVSVIDDGKGIPESEISRVFEPFFTTKPQGSGTGLGLDTVWRIITEEHGGMVTVTSEPGRTEFTVRVPVRGQDTQPIP